MEEINVNHRGQVIHESGSPKKIKVERGQRGGYGWEIEIKGSDDTTMLKWLEDTNAELERVYLSDVPE